MVQPRKADMLPSLIIFILFLGIPPFTDFPFSAFAPVRSPDPVPHSAPSSPSATAAGPGEFSSFNRRIFDAGQFLDIIRTDALATVVVNVELLAVGLPGCVDSDVVICTHGDQSRRPDRCGGQLCWLAQDARFIRCFLDEVGIGDGVRLES